MNIRGIIFSSCLREGRTVLRSSGIVDVFIPEARIRAVNGPTRGLMGPLTGYGKRSSNPLLLNFFILIAQLGNFLYTAFASSWVA